MNDISKAKEFSQGFRDSDSTPFVYFDIAATHGVIGGVIQIEVASRVLTPLADGSGVQIGFITTGRLRCSPEAAKRLQHAIEKSLEMLNMPQDPSGGTAMTRN